MDEEERVRRVRELAQLVWEAEGRPDGQQERHWLMAERLVAAQIAAEQLLPTGGRPETTKESLDGRS